MKLEIDKLSVHHGDAAACREISLVLPDGQFGCLLGPSGSGKTTLLRAIAGFAPPSAGHIRVGDQELSRPGWQLPPPQRGVGLVFQDLALMPHLTVTGNIAFGLSRQPSAQRQTRVAEMLALTGLEPLAGRHPHELSGGQQQRVAVARALAPAPRLLLLDEPFSSLDSDLRLHLAGQVRELIKATGTTALMVTHDQQEAFALGDLVGVLSAGRLQQWDTPSTLYHHPANAFVASFIGDNLRQRLELAQRILFAGSASTPG